MTLPFADKPEVSRVYADLKTKKLSQITDTEINALKASIFAEGVNGTEDEYRRLLLLQLLTTGIPTTGGGGTSNVNVVSPNPLPISIASYGVPPTLEVNINEGAPGTTTEVANVLDTTGSGNPTGDLFVPSAGQVWQLCGLSLAAFNAISVKINLSNTLGTSVVLGTGLLANAPLRIDNPVPIFVTAGLKLTYEITSASGNCNMRAALIRIR